MKRPAGTALILTALLWAGSVPVAAGYLADSEPPRLRYRRPLPAPTPQLALPPLPLFDPVENVATPPVPSAPAPGGEPVAEPDPSAEAIRAASPTNGETTAAPMAPSFAEPSETPTIPRMSVRPVGQITPQLLVPYFSDAEASRAALLLTEPVRFVPPQPIGRATSQATYTRGQ